MEWSTEPRPQARPKRSHQILPEMVRDPQALSGSGGRLGILLLLIIPTSAPSTKLTGLTVIRS
jgi:hypothetical protein